MQRPARHSSTDLHLGSGSGEGSAESKGAMAVWKASAQDLPNHVNDMSWGSIHQALRLGGPLLDWHHLQSQRESQCLCGGRATAVAHGGGGGSKGTNASKLDVVS